MIKEFDSLFEMLAAFPDEQSCVDHFTAIRWKNGAFCPHCGSAKVYHFSDKRTHKCGDCRQRFSIRVGTIFEDSKLPLQKWFMAIWLITSHRKGISSAQIARDLKITQKSGWFMLHRLRYAARTKSFARPMGGDVEADGTFLGGKEKNKHAHKRSKTGKGTTGKTHVFGMLERGGILRAKKIQPAHSALVRKAITDNVIPGSTLHTDDYRGYKGLERRYNHQKVRHTVGQYVREGIYHTNGIEGAWGLFKRQVYGIHHWISPKHTDRYLDEFTWRYNRREQEEGQRVNSMLESTSGRLTYKALIA